MRFPTYTEYMADKLSSQLSCVVTNAVREGMSPFVPKSIELFEEFAIDYNAHRVVAGWYLSSEYFPHTVMLDWNTMRDDPIGEMERVAAEMLQYYRFDIPTIPMYIEGTPTHPHITLGEN